MHRISLVVVLLLASVGAEPQCDHLDCERERVTTEVASSLLQVVSRKRSIRLVTEDSTDPDDSIDLAVLIQSADIDGEDGVSQGANISFMLAGAWSEPMVFDDRMPLGGGLVRRGVRLPEWPERLRILTPGSVPWDYESIQIEIDDIRVTVVNATYGLGSILENETAAGLIMEAEYAIPAMPGHNCRTRFDARIYATGYETAPPGTLCVFGVDVQDEGSHCILEDGSYGSLGWCYTDENRSSWGSCGETCPLFGYNKILGKKIDEVLRVLESQKEKQKDSEDSEAEAEDHVVTVTTTEAPTTTSTNVTENTTSVTATENSTNSNVTTTEAVITTTEAITTTTTEDETGFPNNR